MDQTPTPKIVSTCAAMRAEVRAARAAGQSVGIVPTMGALHAGHLSLVEAARARCDRVVVTIFVNPTQFLPGEDFEQYPRTLESDLESLTPLGVDWVFVPGVEEMYGPRGADGTFQARTAIDVGPPAEELEGRFRPGHFAGVATVVMKLFQIAPADAAFFGLKDYQQLCVIRRMCADLNVPIEIVACPTVRDADGLALSSRNRYLSADERRQALALSAALRWAADEAARGCREAAALVAGVRRRLREAGVTRIDYVALVDADSLEPLATLDRPAVLLLAAHVGQVRLIDNLPLD